MKWICACRRRMSPAGTRALLLATVISSATLCAQDPPAQTASVQEAPDIKIELRSAIGSNRFQMGEVIPVEVLVSSTTPNRYLEPCVLFNEACFGYPQCRYSTRWSFDLTPATGWTDIGSHGCQTMSGPTYEAKSSDLTTDPKKYTYTLSKRFRFDAPGTYTVRLNLTIGLDDETNQIRTQQDWQAKHNFVSKTAEMVLEIVPAGKAWQTNILNDGMAAWTAKPLPYANPPSPEVQKRQQAQDAFCNLGTAEAAVAAAKLLGQGIDTTHCIEINSNKEAATTEMRRLLTAPDVAVHPPFFSEYAKLLSSTSGGHGPQGSISSEALKEARDTLTAALPNKTPQALIVSLNTLLNDPVSGQWVMVPTGQDRTRLYSPELITFAAANFERLPPETQTALLGHYWSHLRSPIMLPVLRREAQRGNGQALLRWQELDPAPATAFMRDEVTTVPRFSALYIRLPETSLSEQDQKQMAANFVALRSDQQLMNEATLLHRYATRAILPDVLPFIDQHLAEWSCQVQVPVLAYLLKVSSDDARTRLEPLLKTANTPYCPRGEFLHSIGYMQPDPILETISIRQIKEDTPLAADAASYLKNYGSASMKPELWQQLVRWHKQYMESGAEQRIYTGQKQQPDDYKLNSLDRGLNDAYINAHGWVLSSSDVAQYMELTGVKKQADLACSFNCGSRLSIGPEPGTYIIYGRLSNADWPFPPDSHDYLKSTSTYEYQINQYGCRDLKSLEEKILQFPAGSKFDFAYTGSGDDAGEWSAIAAFLQSHGYEVHSWPQQLSQ